MVWGCATTNQDPSAEEAPESLELAVSAPLPARPAFDFVNSIGVVTHLRYTNKPYYDDYDLKVRPRLLESGIRHLREGLASNTYLVKDRYLQLASDGIDFSMLCDPRSVSVAQGLAWIKPLRRAVAYVEGPNEFDHKRPDLSWVGTVQTYVKQLYTVFRADPVTKDLPILSPSFLSRSTPALVGKMDRWVDYGNIHPYPYPRAPDANNAVRRMTSIFADMYGNKPFIATETGYHTGGPSSDRPVSEVVQAKYLLRVFLENFNAGVVRSYAYEFWDEGTDPANREDHFGLVRYDGSRKPSYLAIRNLLTILKDTKRPAVSQSLAYTVSPRPRSCTMRCCSIRAAPFTSSSGSK